MSAAGGGSRGGAEHRGVGKPLLGGNVGGAAGTVNRTVVFVCHGPSCSERGSVNLCGQLREWLNESSAARRVVRVCETTCMDNCATGPNVLIGNEGQIQTGMAPDNLAQMIALLQGTSPLG